MIPLLLALSLFGFGCCVVLLVVGANRSSRDCREWLQERQERELALQQRRDEWVRREYERALKQQGEHRNVMDATLADIQALPVYERDGAER
jgi:hypothetical protein